jgi:hypothetical protein
MMTNEHGAAAAPAHWLTGAGLARMMGPTVRKFVLACVADATADLKAEISRHESLLVLAHTSIKTLEANVTTRGGPRWSGEHEPGKSYVAGELVRRRGDVWLCVKDSSAAPGMALGDWELFVRGGQARP